MAELNLTREQVAAYTRRFPSARIWVLGDVMLDRYFWGGVTRISPEAPVPVVQVKRSTARLGGAANVAANLNALGVQVSLLGITGNDAASQELMKMLVERGIASGGILIDPERPTTEKIRIIAQHQQVVRADFEMDRAAPERLVSRFLEELRSGAASGDALVVSDYGKGVVQEKCLKEAIACWRDAGKPVLIDPHVGHFQWYRHAAVITPNSKQARSFFGASLDGEQSLERIGFEIRRALELDAVLITRGEEGMSLFTDGGGHLHVPTVAKEVFDVTGAGDTVISVLAAGLGSGVPLLDSVVLSNQAAGEAVKEIGTATVTCDRLVASFE